MDKFTQRENVLLGAAGFSSKSPNRSSEDLDFNDVFGGPPRRFSAHEVRVRHSFGGAVESEEEITSSPWNSLREKPVFGEETVPRRRHTGNDFFDDIFGGDEPHSSPKSNCDRDCVFGRSPGSRIMSPAWLSPLKHEPFGTSLPAQFSLPGKLTKAMELPAFVSQSHGGNRVDSSANGLRSPQSSSSFSRSPDQVVRGPDGIMNEVHFVYRQSPLSRQASLVSEDLPSTTMSNQKGNLENLMKEIGNADDDRGNHFHFSIYKWVGVGVPMLLSLLAGSNLKSKHKTKDDAHFSTVKKQDLAARGLGFSKREHEKENKKSQEEAKELQDSIEETFLKVMTLKSRSGLNGSVVCEEKVKPLCANDRVERIEKVVSLKAKESLPSDAKPLLAWLSVEDEHSDEMTNTKENKTTIAVAEEVLVNSKNVKKVKSMRTDSTNNAEVDKSGVKGKVREFAQIFSQDAASVTKGDVRRRSRSYRWKAVYSHENEKVIINVANEKGKVNLHHADKKPADAHANKVGENLKYEEKEQYSPNKTSSYKSIGSSSNMKVFSSETLPKDPKVLPEMDDDISVVDFLVEELSDDPENVAPTKNLEDTRAIDTKIKQWSTGKQGNIRSLLSTLQFVLWTGSGWNPVPLVDLIEANSVKRAYQKALLRLHPDKLQQTNAPFHQKYSAEKIFDILQEAWDHFNTLVPL